MMLKELINLIYPKDYLQPKFAAVVGAVAAVGGAAIAADGAKQSGKAIQRGAEASNELQKYMFEKSREDQLPWMNRGNEAGNRLQYLLGLSPTGGAATYGGQTAASFVPKTEQQFRNEMLEQYTSGTAYDGGYFDAMDGIWRGDRGIKQGTVDETGLQAAIQKAMQAQTEYQSGLTTAEKAAADARANDPEYGSLLRTFSKEDLDKDIVYQNGLQFGLDEGRKGVTNMLAASGSMLSGAALKALTRFGNDYATTKTGDAYNRFNNNQSQIYNRLAGISGTGQTTSNQIADQSMKVGASMGENKLMGGIARGSSYQGVNNALQNGISGVYGAGKKAGWWDFGSTTPDYSGVQTQTYGSGGSYADNPFQGYGW